MAPQVQPKCFQGVIDTTLQQFGSYIIQVHRQSLSVTHPITILYLVMYLDEMMAPMMMLARWYYCDGKLCNWSSRDLAPTTRGRHSPGPQPLITRSWMIMMMMTMMRMMMMMMRMMMMMMRMAVMMLICHHHFLHCHDDPYHNI